LLERSRVVTLTGPPGVGKTRLAIELARRWDARHPGDVWFVDLSSVRDESDVDVALRGALGSGANDEPARGLATRLADRAGLLVLDDALAASAMLRDALSVLAACPHLRILATSRERLGVDREQTIQHSPLEVPEASMPPHRRRRSRNCALDRVARRGRAGSAARVPYRRCESADAVARIARAVDGLPLALELAGAMLHDDAIDVVAARLERATSTAPGHDDRLETLLRVSHAGLLDDERALVRRSGAVSRAAGRSSPRSPCVAGMANLFSMLDLLTRLVEKSFVVIERGDRVEPALPLSRADPQLRHAPA
jgi:predicted ATPase